MVGPIQDMCDALFYESKKRVVPTRLQRHNARTSGELEYSLHAIAR